MVGLSRLKRRGCAGESRIGMRRGFQHAYETVKVDPSKFLLQVRAAYGLPINSFQGVYSVEVAEPR